MRSIPLGILGLFVWPDSYPDWVAYIFVAVFPFAVFEPVTGTIHLAALFFVIIWRVKRYRRDKHQNGRSGWALAGWIIGGYIVITTATNLLLFWMTA